METEKEPLKPYEHDYVLQKNVAESHHSGNWSDSQRAQVERMESCANRAYASLSLLLFPEGDAPKFFASGFPDRDLETKTAAILQNDAYVAMHVKSPPGQIVRGIDPLQDGGRMIRESVAAILLLAYTRKTDRFYDSDSNATSAALAVVYSALHLIEPLAKFIGDTPLR